MSQSDVALAALVRVSIVSEGRRLDVGVPTQVPLVELLPGFARSLGVLDPTLAHGGYALHKADGTILDPARGAGAQGLKDGELLTLVRGGLVAETRLYDDVVEAVIDATSEQHTPWTPRDNARTALAVSLTFLGLCAVLLVSSGSALGVGAIIAGAAAVVLLSTSAVLGRLGQPEAAHALGLAAALFGGIGGYLAVPVAQPWGWPLAAGGLGALLTGGAALLLARTRAELHLVPIAFGTVVGLTGLAAALLAPGSPAPWAIMIAVVGSLANGLPWLALSSTRIRVISPQSDLDVIATPEPINAEDVKKRAAAGQRILTALRIALGLSILLATALVAGSGGFGTALCALAFVGMMFQSRQVYGRAGVLVVMVMGAVGLAVTGLTASAALPGLRPALLVILLVATAVLVGLTLLSPKARLRLARIADTVEVLVLASLLPLGVLASGLV